MEDQIYDDSLMLTPIMDITLAKARLKEFQDFIRGYLIQDEDYGTIPGTPKPTLYKPGADKLCEVYGLADTYQILDKTVDFNSGLFDYEIQCTLVSKRNGSLAATGMGSCSSFEGKYRWRDGKRSCPQCGNATIFASKNDPGFYCWAKKGGCAAKFAEDDQSILSQPLGKIENDDFATLKNTIMKMAKKRAKVDATLSATRSSGIFSQDIGDGDDERGKKSEARPRNGGGGSARPQEPQRKSEKLDAEQEAYVNALQGRQWVAESRRGWMIHAVKGFFLAGGNPEQLEGVMTEAVGVASPDLVKDEQAPAAVAAIEAATKLGGNGNGAKKKEQSKSGASVDPQLQRSRIDKLLLNLSDAGCNTGFDVVELAGGTKKLEKIPDDKLQAVADALELKLKAARATA